VLDSQLLYYVRKPDEIINLHGMARSTTIYPASCNTVSLQSMPAVGTVIIPQQREKRQRCRTLKVGAVLPDEVRAGT
jgi:hypothetical protein